MQMFQLKDVMPTMSTQRYQQWGEVSLMFWTIYRECTCRVDLPFSSSSANHWAFAVNEWKLPHVKLVIDGILKNFDSLNWYSVRNLSFEILDSREPRHLENDFDSIYDFFSNLENGYHTKILRSESPSCFNRETQWIFVMHSDLSVDVKDPERQLKP